MKITAAVKEIREYDIDNDLFNAYALENGYDINNEDEVIECLEGYIFSEELDNHIVIDSFVDTIVINYKD